MRAVFWLLPATVEYNDLIRSVRQECCDGSDCPYKNVLTTVATYRRRIRHCFKRGNFAQVEGTREACMRISRIYGWAVVAIVPVLLRGGVGETNPSVRSSFGRKWCRAVLNQPPVMRTY